MSPRLRHGLRLLGLGALLGALLYAGYLGLAMLP